MEDSSIAKLKELSSQDLFGPDGFLYTGVQDQKQKKALSEKFKGLISAFIMACTEGASSEQLLALLKTGLAEFDRISLETEDAENLAGNFEKLMDCVGLESSKGALNEWMYGFDL